MVTYREAGVDVAAADGWLARLRPLMRSTRRAGVLPDRGQFAGLFRLGRLKLTKAGLAARDRMVFDFCELSGIPVAVTMAGGYARTIADTVDIHFATVAEAARRVRG